MNKEIKKIYLSGIKNNEFLADIKEANGDEKPSKFAIDLEKHLFSAAYYGWLVGRYGNNWKDYI